jgi:hypothetical protein
MVETWVDPDKLLLREYFVSGINTTGHVGNLGWQIAGSNQSYGLHGYNVGGYTLCAVAPTSSLPCHGFHLGPKALGAGAGNACVSSINNTTAPLTTIQARFRTNSYALPQTAFAFGIGAGPGVCDKVMPANSLGAAWIPYGTTRVNSFAYALGAVMRPSGGNDRTYICTTAGTSAGSPPEFATNYGTTTTDGTAVWTCAGREGSATGKWVVWVAGADPLVNYVSAESTVAASGAGQVFNLAIYFDATNAYFSINKETPVALARAGVEFFLPFFVTRNDTNNVASFGATALWVVQHFSLTVLDRL